MRKRFLPFFLVMAAALLMVMPVLAEKATVKPQESGPQPLANLLTESFTSATFPPTGWNAYNIDGGGTAWARNTTATYYHTAPASAGHGYSSAGMQDGWLVSPAVAIPAGGANLTFWEYTQYPTYLYRHSVMVCSSNCLPPTAPFTDWTEVFFYDTGATAAWRQQSLSLNAYAGQTIYIAFRYQGNDADSWFIDDINVDTLAPIISYQSSAVVDDVCGALGGPGEHNGFIDQGETITLNVTLQNTGTAAASGVAATLSTTTPGITITTSGSTFPDIPIAGTGASITPFAFTVDQSIACGTEIDFTLNITGSDGPWVSNFSLTVGNLNFLLNENFSAVAPPALPPGWLAPAPPTGNPWLTLAAGCTNNGLRCYYSSTAASNAWAFTPALSLVAGTDYTFSFNQKTGGYSEKLSVWLGNDQLDTAMTVEIMPETTFTNTACELRSFTINVAATGTYYIGFHCTSDADQFYITVDDIQVSSLTCLPCTTSCLPFSFTPSDLPSGQIGVAYSETITASNGTAPYTYVISLGSLPSGLSMDSAGNITGTPDTSGVYNFTVTATDSVACTGIKEYTIEICSTITVSPATLPGGHLGVAYSQTLTSTGGVAPYSYTVIAGSLPPGLTLSSAGLLEGTPTTQGIYNFEIGSQDVWGCVGSQVYTIQVCPVITLNPTALPDGAVNVPYSQAITAVGGAAPYSYAVTSGALIPGFTLSSAGLLEGTSATPAGCSFTVTATDADGCTASQAYTLGIFPTHCGDIEITVPAQGSDSPDWPTLHGTQNTRLFRDGTPSDCDVKAFPGTSGTGTRTYDAFTFSNEACADVCVTATLTPACSTYLVGAVYLDSYDPTNLETNFIGDPGTSPAPDAPVTFQFTIPLHQKAVVVVTMATSTDTCPEGYTLTLSDVPCSGSGFALDSASIVTDVCGLGGHGDSNGILDPGEDVTITVNTTNNGQDDATNVAATLTSTSPYVTITQGSTTFPDIIQCASASNSGANFEIHLSGAAPCGSSIPFTVHFTSNEGSIDRNFNLPVSPGAAVTIYTQDFETWPLTDWTIEGPGPCLWDSSDNTGTTNYAGSGACADADSGVCEGATETTMTSPVFSLAGLSTASVEFNYAFADYYGTSYGEIAMTTDGGTNWTTLGSLEAGEPSVLYGGPVTLDLTPFVGNPNCQIVFYYYTEAWEYFFEVDDFAVVGISSALCSSLSCCPTIVLSPPNLPNVMINTAYSQTISASGGTGPYTYSVASGTLPTGLSLNGTTGELSGTAIVPGTFNFTVRAQEPGGCGANAIYSIQVVCPDLPTITGDSTNLCPSLVAHLAIAGSFTSIQWNLDGSAISGANSLTYDASVSGSYTVTVADDFGCGGTTAEHPVTIHSCATVLPVPYSVTPTAIATSNMGVDGTITWDVANCTSTNYHIIYGKGENLAAWTVDGGVCAIGTTGSYNWMSIPDPSTYTSGFLWFLILGDDGATTEGSWGLTSTGDQRGGTNPSNVCGFGTKDTSGTCGTP